MSLEAEPSTVARSKKNKRKNNSNSNNKKNRHAGSNKKMRHNEQREWILACRDSQPPSEGESYDIELLVTRSNLQDDYGKIMPANTTQDAASNSVASDGNNSNPGNGKEAELEPDEKIAASNLKSEDTVPIILLHPLSETNPEANNETPSPSSTNRSNDLNEGRSPTVGIKKSSNPKKPMQKFYSDSKNYTPRPNGDCGDGILNPHPKEEVPDKYWSQRHRFFTLFDQGIQLDKESWFSVTPEAIAKHIAHRLASKPKIVIFDPFCGCGGNAIAFAAQSRVKQVVCVDMDRDKLKKVYHNAYIYGVQRKLLLVHGNAFDVLSRYKDGKLIESESTKECELPASMDTIFLSPPWGGIDYGAVGKHGFDLTCIKIDDVDGSKVDGERLLQCAAKALGNRTIAYFLPKNINGVAFSVSALKAGYTTPIVMEQNILNGKLKTVTAYLGLGGA